MYKHMSPEEAKEQRQKELAALKASNEMLEDAKQNLLDRDDVVNPDQIIREIEAAQQENVLKAKNVYQATQEEVQSIQYNNVSVQGIKDYEKRLKARGLTDEQLHRKNIAVATTGDPTPTEKPKKIKRTVIGEGKMVDTIKTEEVENTEETKTKKKKVKKIAPKTKTLEFEEVDPKVEIAVDKTQDDEAEMVTPQEISDKIKSNSDLPVVNKQDSDFNFGDIPSYVQFDIIPLPSHGECYKHKKSRIPVAYLTASDENIIASPNIYRDGNLLDVILERKILDKSIKASELCTGDRDAIILWLRATSYGTMFPIMATEPRSGKKYDVEVDLSKVKYKPFDLKSNEDALFEYKTESGDVFMFKYLTAKEEEDVRKELRLTAKQSDALNIYKNALNIIDTTTRLELPDNLQNDIKESAQSIADAIEEIGGKLDERNTVTPIITMNMKAHTVSINGKTDKEFIDGYIDNMRAGDARKYRDYLFNNKPGIDLSVKVDIPETDGGGSFTTFLRIDDTVFFNA